MIQMSKYWKALVAAVVMAGAASSVAIADGYEYEPVGKGFAPPKVWSWTGFYVGGHFGWAWTDVNVIDLDSYQSCCPFPEGNFGYDLDDPFGGVQAGYNAQSGSIVYGIEGELGYLGLDESAQFPPYVGVRLPTDSLSSIDGGIYGTIAGRVGFAANGFLVYGKGGWGFADVDVSFIDDDPTGITLVSGTSTDATIDGPVYGGGVEFAVGSNATLKFEYLRFDFDESVTVRATDSIAVLRRFRHEIDPIDTVKFGFNLKLY